MKKLLTTLAALFCAAAGYALEAGTATNPNDRAEYRWVLNADAVAHEFGDIVVLKDGTYDGVEVATTTSADNKLVVGVVGNKEGSTAYELPASGYGWIQVYGYHPAIQMAEDNSAGDCIGTSTTAEEGGVTTTAGACIAVALEAQTSSTTVKGFIKGM